MIIIPHTANIKLLGSIKLVSCEESDLFISGDMGRLDQYAALTNTKKIKFMIRYVYDQEMLFLCTRVIHRHLFRNVILLFWYKQTAYFSQESAKSVELIIKQAR